MPHISKMKDVIDDMLDECKKMVVSLFTWNEILLNHQKLSSKNQYQYISIRENLLVHFDHLHGHIMMTTRHHHTQYNLFKPLCLQPRLMKFRCLCRNTEGKRDVLSSWLADLPRTLPSPCAIRGWYENGTQYADGVSECLMRETPGEIVCLCLVC